MKTSFQEILTRTKEGPIIEEKAFDLSIFNKTQELQKKYHIRYNPETPLDTKGEMADRVYQAGIELFLDIGTYCTTTRRAVKVTEKELFAEINACSMEIELGQGEDCVKMVHRQVESDVEPIVVAGVVVNYVPFDDNVCSSFQVNGILGGATYNIISNHYSSIGIIIYNFLW